MSYILDTLTCTYPESFLVFEQVFLFGSSLWSDSPNDIDILLVYPKDLSGEVTTAKAWVVRMLQDTFPGFLIDVTTLSEHELETTQFLRRVANRCIRGQVLH